MLPSSKVTPGAFLSASPAGPAAAASEGAAGTGAPAEFAPAAGGFVIPTAILDGSKVKHRNRDILQVDSFMLVFHTRYIKPQATMNSCHT